MIEEQRMTAAKLVAAGLASHQLLDVRHFRPDDELYAVVKIEPRARALEGGLPAAGDAATFTETESADLTGSIDWPADRVRHYPWRKFTWKKGP